MEAATCHHFIDEEKEEFERLHHAPSRSHLESHPPTPGPSHSSPHRASRVSLSTRPRSPAASGSLQVGNKGLSQPSSSSEIAELKGWIRPYFEQTFSLLQDLTDRVKWLERRLDRMESGEQQPTTSTTTCPVALPEGFTFPIGEMEALEFLEKVLRERTDVKEAMIGHLANIGGSGPGRGMWLMGKELLKARLSIQFNLTGTKGKRSLDQCMPTFRNVVYEALRQNNPGFTVEQFRKVFSKWLTGSYDRDGMKQERESEKRRPSSSV